MLSLAVAGSADEALSAYRELSKHIAEARRELSSADDKGAILTNLNLERDGIDARFPYRPGEPAALTAERRRVDVEIRSLTHHTSKKAAPPAKKPKRAKRG